MRKNLRNVCVCMAICLTTPSMAQEAIFETVGDNMTATAISPNGKWIGLNMPGELGTNIETYLYNTETQAMTQMNNAYEVSLAHAKAISPGGLQVGCYGMDDLKTPAAYYKDDAWTLLPVPQEREGKGSIAFCVSDDETLIGGEIEGLPIGKPALPCLWRLKDGEYNVELLPYPELDVTGSVSPGGGVMGMSSDGSVLVGTIYDWTAFASVLVVWTKEKKGYTYKIYGENIAYNLEEENPGQCPEYEDYVTAQPGTPEYEEQYRIWKPLSEKYFQLREKFYTGDTFEWGAFISPNGRYIALNVKKAVGSGEEMALIPFPYRIDLQTGEEICYEEAQNIKVKSVLDDGTVIAYGGMMYQERGCVFPQNSTVAVKMEDWITQKFKMDIPEELIYEDGVITGYPLVSSDGSVIAGTFSIPDIWTDLTYYVRYAPSSIDTTQGADKASVFVREGYLNIQGAAEHISLVGLAGKVVYDAPVNGTSVDITHLPKGVYIVKLVSNGEVISSKIIY